MASDRLLWSKDGKNGPDDLTTSMSILLKWITTEGNYNKYRGGPTSHGKGKIYWCTLLSDEIKKAGIRRHRSLKAIKNKIANIKDLFKNAHYWAHQTGAGVKEDDPGQFNDYILKKCPYYFDLLPVMQDRATAHPLMTSESMENEHENDNRNSNDDDDFAIEDIICEDP